MRWIEGAQDFVGSRNRETCSSTNTGPICYASLEPQSAREAANSLFSTINLLEKRHYGPVPYPHDERQI